MKPEKTTQEWFAEKLESLRDDPAFVLEGVILDITAQIADEIERQGLTRAELASRIDVHPPAITRFMNGPGNMTLSTAVRIGMGLGLDLRVRYVPRVHAKQFGEKTASKRDVPNPLQICHRTSTEKKPAIWEDKQSPRPLDLSDSNLADSDEPTQLPLAI